MHWDRRSGMAGPFKGYKGKPTLALKTIAQYHIVDKPLVKINI
jgi:hypothetical protein